MKLAPSTHPLRAFPIQLGTVFAVMALVIMGAGSASASKVKKGSNIPVAHSGAVSVYRNAPVAIRLKATTGSTSRLNFVIRNQPKHGTLSVIRPVEGDNRVSEVVYTPDPGSEALLDQFTYSALVTGEPPSSAAAVDIRIFNPRPILQVEAPVQFRKVRVGEVGLAAFVVRNVGRAPFRGRIELLSPWSLDRDILEVAPGVSERVTVEFRPLVPGKVGTRLRLQAGEDGAVVGIYAEGVAPFTANPGSLQMLKSAGGRRAMLSISNKTDDPMIVSLHAAIDPDHPSSRLRFPEVVELEPQGENEVIVSLPSGDMGPIDEALTLSSRSYSTEVRVAADALPAHLILVEPASNDGWNFGTVKVGESIEPKKIVLANWGGASVVGTVSVRPPFALDKFSQSLEIKGGQELELTVLPGTENAGNFRSELVFQSAAGRVAVPLSLRVELPDSSNRGGGSVATTDGGNTGAPATSPPKGTSGGGGVVKMKDPRAGIRLGTPSPTRVLPMANRSKADSLFEAYAAHYGLSLTEDPYVAKLPAVANVNLLGGDHRAVELSWNHAGPGVKDYVIEMAKMFRDVENGGMIVKRWVSWPGQIKSVESEGGDEIAVRLEPVMPGTEYHFRVIGRDAKGRRALPSEPIVLITGVAESMWKKILRWSLIPLGLIALFVGYRIFVAYRDRAEKGRLHAGAESGGIRGALEELKGAIFR